MSHHRSCQMSHHMSHQLSHHISRHRSYVTSHIMPCHMSCHVTHHVMSHHMSCNDTCHKGKRGGYGCIGILKTWWLRRRLRRLKPGPHYNSPLVLPKQGTKNGLLIESGYYSSIGERSSRYGIHIK